MGLDNPIHLIFLLILLLLVFGAKRLPEMGRSLGSGMRGFKDSLTGENVQSTVTTQPTLSTQQQVAPAAAPVAQSAAPVTSAPAAGAPAPAPALGPVVDHGTPAA